MMSRLACVLAISTSAIVLSLPTSAQPNVRQTNLFINNCAQCHARQETGAPIIGVTKDWQEAVKRGEDSMLENVVHGMGGMPPLGYCSACNEDDFRVLIRMMSGTTEHSRGQQ